jgi:hypothetical protein
MKILANGKEIDCAYLDGACILDNGLEGIRIKVQVVNKKLKAVGFEKSRALFGQTRK